MSRAMLDPDYYARSIVYERDLMGEGEGPVDYLITRYSQALYDGSAIPENTYDALHSYTEAEVKKADVIVLDVCMNNVAL